MMVTSQSDENQRLLRALELLVHVTRRSTLDDRTFPVAASRAWNSLPASVRDIQSLPAFRQKLKLTLFSDSFAS